MEIKSIPNSRLTVNELYNLSNTSMFKTSIEDRAFKVGKVIYKGFKYIYHRNPKGKLVLYVNLYFYVNGAPHKSIRERYLLVAKFPYIKDIKNIKRLYNYPVQIFSSDPSFKYYLTYALNQFNAVITDDIQYVNHLGKSLTTKPNINNPKRMAELTKHFFKFFNFIGNVPPKRYLDKKYEIDPKDNIRIINKNAK